VWSGGTLGRRMHVRGRPRTTNAKPGGLRAIQMSVTRPYLTQ
jgi:hypothetical protein